jgi:hypothetical protein
MREMRRLVVATVLSVFAMLGTVPGAGAQIPPVDDATDALEETVEETVEAVEGTLGGATEAVGGTGGGGTSAAEQGAEGTAGSVIGSAAESTGVLSRPRGQRPGTTPPAQHPERRTRRASVVMPPPEAS